MLKNYAFLKAKGILWLHVSLQANLLHFVFTDFKQMEPLKQSAVDGGCVLG